MLLLASLGLTGREKKNEKASKLTLVAPEDQIWSKFPPTLLAVSGVSDSIHDATFLKENHNILRKEKKVN